MFVFFEDLQPQNVLILFLFFFFLKHFYLLITKITPGVNNSLVRDNTTYEEYKFINPNGQHDIIGTKKFFRVELHILCFEKYCFPLW